MSRRLVMVVVGIGAMAFALAGCFGNGPHAVGTGQQGLVAPGLYRTLGDDGGPCNVTRYDSSGTPHYYSNATGGPLYLKLKADDTTVTSAKCKIWQAAGLVPPIFVTSTPGSFFRSGDYRVGYEIQPGKYVAPGYTGNGVCKWAIVKDFVHDGTDQVIGNYPNGTTNLNEPIGPVNITSSDYGFTSEGCGDWVRQ